MADVHDMNTRSYNMSRIRSKNTKPELLVRKFLFSQGYRFRVHQKELPGKPDIVLKKYKTIVLIHGCFWHQHDNCKYAAIPQTRTDYWLPKLKKNKENDIINNAKLVDLGWDVITIYECQLKKNNVENTFIELTKRLYNKLYFKCEALKIYLR